MAASSVRRFRCDQCGELLTSYQTTNHHCWTPLSRRVIFIGAPDALTPGAEEKMKAAEVDAWSQGCLPVSPEDAFSRILERGTRSWEEAAAALLHLCQEVWALPGWSLQLRRAAMILGKNVVDYKNGIA